MYRCEDYPCCGHEQGECVDPDREDAETHWPLPCVECGGRIAVGEEGTPSMHKTCQDEYLRKSDPFYDANEWLDRDDDDGDVDEDEFSDDPPGAVIASEDDVDYGDPHDFENMDYDE